MPVGNESSIVENLEEAKQMDLGIRSYVFLLSIDKQFGAG